MASLDDRFGWFWIPHRLEENDPVVVMLCCQFDEQCDADEIAIKEVMRIELRDRKLAAIRCVSFPIDFIGILILFDFAYAMRRWALQKKLWQFVRKKISHSDLIKAIKEFG